MGPNGRDLIRRALDAGRTSLDEREAKVLLSMYGVPTPAGTVVHDAQRAAAAVAALGGLAVLKALGPDIQHKSDLGLVELDVRDAAAARAAYHRIVDRAAGRADDGVLVEELVPHERELLVGMRRDEQFGLVVAFGLGGIFTEAVADVAFALAPLDDADGRALVAELRAQPLLGRLRGLPRVDIRQLLGVLKAVVQMAEDHPEIAEIDVNPLLVAGSDLVAADALVILAAPGDGATLEHGAPCDRAVGRRHELDAVFAPASIAVVGGSDDATKWGGSVLANLLGGGFEGAIYPINPRGGTITGLRAYASLHELPETPDLAVVALGSAAAIPEVEECGRSGVAAAIVIAAGFAEAGEDGAAQQARLARAAADGGVTLIGPNCMGVLCTSARLNAVGFVTLRPEQGPLSVISQSGNIGTQLLMTAERRGIGVEKFVSSGNQATTDANDLLEYLAGDARTKVIAMYIEGLADGRRFYELARATTPRKPVVVLRGGLSALGRQAASSHTGALAGSAAVFRGRAARQAGVIVTADPDEALDSPRCSPTATAAAAAVWRPSRSAVAGAYSPPTSSRRTVSARGPSAERGRCHRRAAAAVLESREPYRPRRNCPGRAGGDIIRGRHLRPAWTASSHWRSSGARAAGGRDEMAGGGTWATRARRHVRSFLGLDQREGLARAPRRRGRADRQAHRERAALPVERLVFPGPGRYAAILLPTPTAAVGALARATWYATHPSDERGTPDDRLRTAHRG